MMVGAGDADDEFAVWIGLQIGILQDADASAPLREIRLQIVAEIVETEHDKKKVWLLYVPHGQVFGIIDVPCEKVLRGRLPSFAVVEDEYLLVVVVLQIAFLRIFEVARGFVETRQDIVETATGIVRLEAFRSGLAEALPGDCPELCRAPIAEIAVWLHEAVITLHGPRRNIEIAAERPAATAFVVLILSAFEQAN